MPCVNYFIVIIYYDAFLYIKFRINFSKKLFFCVLAQENQEAFIKRYSVISAVLQGLVKT